MTKLEILKKTAEILQLSVKRIGLDEDDRPDYLMVSVGNKYIPYSNLKFKWDPFNNTGQALVVAKVLKLAIIFYEKDVLVNYFVPPQPLGPGIRGIISSGSQLEVERPYLDDIGKATRLAIMDVVEKLV